MCRMVSNMQENLSNYETGWDRRIYLFSFGISAVLALIIHVGPWDVCMPVEPNIYLQDNSGRSPFSLFS